jgi:hypothetical protein
MIDGLCALPVCEWFPLGRLTTKNRKKKKRKFRIKKTKQSGGKKWGKNFGCSARLPFGSSPVVSQGPPKVGEDLF